MAEIKYRPSLSLSEIDILVTRLEGSGYTNLCNKLKLCKMKAEFGIIKPSYVASEIAPPTDAEKLGFEDISPPAPEDREKLFNAWRLAPKTITAKQLELVDLYRWENNMMTEEEEAAYSDRAMPAM